MPHAQPWNGNHYAVLGVPETATPAEIRAAYLVHAKQAHPDRGGDKLTFSAVQAAYETLHDPATRRVYDASRHVPPPIAPMWQPAPDQGTLLDVLAIRHPVIDPTRQLVVLCGLCSRPSTCTCSSCDMPLCVLCTRTPHWRGAIPLHWPLVDVPGHLNTQLARVEMDMKKLHDARTREAADPHHRTEACRHVLRAVRAAAAHAQELAATGADATAVWCCTSQNTHVDNASNKPTQVWTAPPLGTLYKWCQSQLCVYVAVYVPTAFADVPVTVSLTGRELLFAPHGTAPVLRRRLAHNVDPTCPMHTTRYVAIVPCLSSVFLGGSLQSHFSLINVSFSVAAFFITTVVPTFRTADGRFWVLVFPKATPNSWGCLFEGDSLGTRRLPTLTTLTTAPDQLHVGFLLPRWVAPSDVLVQVDAHALRIDTPLGCVVRTMEDGQFLDGVDWDVDRGRLATMLHISLPFLPTVSRPDVPCFVEDSDEFGLEPVLQASIFAATGQAPLRDGTMVTHEARLPDSARAMLCMLRTSNSDV